MASGEIYGTSSGFDAWDRIAYNRGFNDVSVCAIMEHADVEYEDKCYRVLKKLAAEFEKRGDDLDTDINDKKALTERLGDRGGGVAWGQIYHQCFMDVLEDHGLADSVYRDKYGALCYVDEIDGEREVHCGDGNDDFPWYEDKKDLEKNLGDPVGTNSDDDY